MFPLSSVGDNLEIFPTDHGYRRGVASVNTDKLQCSPLSFSRGLSRLTDQTNSWPQSGFRPSGAPRRKIAADPGTPTDVFAEEISKLFLSAVPVGRVADVGFEVRDKKLGFGDVGAPRHAHCIDR